MPVDSSNAPFGKRLRDAVGSILSEINTPFYLLDLNRVRENLSIVTNAWRQYFPSVEVVYPYKTNPLTPITTIMNAAGCSAEVISRPELSWALADGFKRSKLLYSGPAKAFGDICTAITESIYFQVDCCDEMLQLARATQHLRTKVSVAVRMSCPLSNNKWSRFGVLHSEFLHLVEHFADSSININGIHFHCGSNMESPNKLCSNLRLHLSALRYLIARHKTPIRLNIGGGFGVPTGSVQTRRLFHKRFAQSIFTALRQGNIPRTAISLFIEPGRCLVEDAGVIVGHVLTRKVRHGKRLLGLDVGSNLLRGGLKDAHCIRFPGRRNGKSAYYELYGSLCFEPDLIESRVKGPNEVHLADAVLIGGVGAYAFPGAYPWSYESPRIFCLNGTSISEVRRKQRLGEVISEPSPVV